MVPTVRTLIAYGSYNGSYGSYGSYTHSVWFPQLSPTAPTVSKVPSQYSASAPLALFPPCLLVRIGPLQPHARTI